MVAAFEERGGDLLRPAIAPHGKLHGASRGNLANHAAKLRSAFDALAIDFRDHIVFFQARFGCRAIFHDFPQHHATFRGQLEFLGFFRGYFVGFHAQPTRVPEGKFKIPGFGCGRLLAQLFNLLPKRLALSLLDLWR